MTLIVVLEGPDGCGKTRHADALAAALRAEGINAAAWHHPKPPVDAARTPWRMALHYAAARADLAAAIAEGIEDAAVVVCDRWLWSAYVAAVMTPDGAQHNALWQLVRAERDVLPRATVILLTAPRAVVEARLLARPEEVPPTLGDAMGEYHDLAQYHGWPVVDTDRDPREVTRELVGIVRGMLGAALPQGVCPAPTEGER